MIEFRLKVLLTEAGIKLKSFAKVMEVDANTITQWCSKGVPLNRMNDVCRYLGCMPNDLYLFKFDLFEEVADTMVRVFGVSGKEIWMQPDSEDLQLLLTTKVIDFDKATDGYTISEAGLALIECDRILAARMLDAAARAEEVETIEELWEKMNQ